MTEGEKSIAQKIAKNNIRYSRKPPQKAIHCKLLCLGWNGTSQNSRFLWASVSCLNYAKYHTNEIVLLKFTLKSLLYNFKVLSFSSTRKKRCTSIKLHRPVHRFYKQAPEVRTRISVPLRGPNVIQVKLQLWC